MTAAENRRLSFDAEGPSFPTAAPNGPSLLQDIRDRIGSRNHALEAEDSETLDLLAFCHQAILLEIRGAASSFAGPTCATPTGERRWRDILRGEKGNLSLKDVCRLAKSDDPRARAAARRVARHILKETEEEIEAPSPLVVVSDIATAEGALIADLARQVGTDGHIDCAVLEQDLARTRVAIDEVEALVAAELRDTIRMSRPAAREARL